MTLTSKAKARKLLLASGLGFVAGAGGMMGFLAFDIAPVLDLERIVVGGVGVVYLMTGLFTLLGASLPGLGARVLNVADREELIELRAVLSGSAITVISVGVMLLALAGSGPNGTVPDAVAIGAVALAIIVSLWVTMRQWKLYDELWRQLSLESSSISLSLLLPILLVWAVAVHLGHLDTIQPLTMVGLAAGSVLVGSFIAAGRRGLLTPR